MNVPGCEVERVVKEHIKVVGPMEKSGEVMSQLHADGWSISTTGPYTNGQMFPKCDPKRFIFHAEREIEHDEVPAEPDPERAIGTFTLDGITYDVHRNECCCQVCKAGYDYRRERNALPQWEVDLLRKIAMGRAARRNVVLNNIPGD